MRDGTVSQTHKNNRRKWKNPYACRQIESLNSQPIHSIYTLQCHQRQQWTFLSVHVNEWMNEWMCMCWCVCVLFGKAYCVCMYCGDTCWRWQIRSQLFFLNAQYIINLFVFVYKLLCLVSVILDLYGQKKIEKKLFFIIRFIWVQFGSIRFVCVVFLCFFLFSRSRFFSKNIFVVNYYHLRFYLRGNSLNGINTHELICMCACSKSGRSLCRLDAKNTTTATVASVRKKEQAIQINRRIASK